MKHIALLLALLPFAALAQNAPQATVTFVGPTHYVDETPIPAGKAIWYEIYQGEKGTELLWAGTFRAESYSVDDGLVVGREYCWQVKAVVDGVASDISDAVCKRIGATSGKKPQRVVIVVT